MVQWRLVRSSLFQLDTMEVFVSLIASGACEQYPDLKFVLGESGVTWLPYVFDRPDTEYEDRGRALGFKLKPSDYFRRQGYTTYQQDQYLEASCAIQVRAQSGRGELIPAAKEVMEEGYARAAAAQRPRGGQGALVWPGLLRRLDRADPSYRD